MKMYIISSTSWLRWLMLNDELPHSRHLRRQPRQLYGEEQKAVKTTAFDLRMNPANSGMVRGLPSVLSSAVGGEWKDDHAPDYSRYKTRSCDAPYDRRTLGGTLDRRITGRRDGRRFVS